MQGERIQLQDAGISRAPHTMSPDTPNQKLIETLYVGAGQLSWGARLSPNRWQRLFTEDIAWLNQYRFVIYNLVFTQTKIRYHRSTLGVFWTLLNPLLLLGVQSLVFSQILRLGYRDYALYLFSGLLPWQFFASALDGASRTLIANEGLIRKVAAPKIIFPLSDVLFAGVNLLLSFVALFLFFLLFRAPLHPQVILLIPGIILLTGFIFGLSLIGMTLVTFFRDVGNIIGVGLSALYFISPVLYPPRMIREHDHFLRFNPLSYYLDFFHCALIEGRVLTDNAAMVGGIWPPLSTWIISTAFTLGTIMIGYIVYKSNEHEYIFRL